MEKKTIDKRLDITRTGTIFSNLGNVRGINFEPALEVTKVKYICREEIPPRGEMVNSFIFQGKLPLDIEGWKFNFGEVYPKESEKDIPLFQTLFAYLEYDNKRKEKTFVFHK
jgi:hypothetical protein